MVVVVPKASQHPAQRVRLVCPVGVSSTVSRVLQTATIAVSIYRPIQHIVVSAAMSVNQVKFVPVEGARHHVRLVCPYVVAFV